MSELKKEKIVKTYIDTQRGKQRLPGEGKLVVAYSPKFGLEPKQKPAFLPAKPTIYR